MRYLDLPAQVFWRDLPLGTDVRQVVVQARLGKTLQLVVEVQG